MTSILSIITNNLLNHFIIAKKYSSAYVYTLTHDYRIYRDN